MPSPTFLPETNAGRVLWGALRDAHTFAEIMAASESVRVGDLSAREMAELERQAGCGRSGWPSMSADPLSAARLAELRAALHPEPDARLAESVLGARLSLHPDLAAEWERERRYVDSYGKRKARDGRASGWRKGTPQCPGCRRILSARDGWCPSCRTFAGRHDHGR